jgi:hypothetical protein
MPKSKWFIQKINVTGASNPQLPFKLVDRCDQVYIVGGRWNFVMHTSDFIFSSEVTYESVVKITNESLNVALMSPLRSGRFEADN